MDWIKRNLYFLIGAVVALALMGLAGWFLYSQWGLNNEMLTSLNADYEKLRALTSQKPHPGAGKIDNIQTAREQQQQVKELTAQARTHFERVTPIPDSINVTNVSDQEFSSALSQTIFQLQREATNLGINLPANYGFSFQAQRQKLSFAANSPGPLSVQLGEVRAICDVLLQSRVNSIDNLRREKVSSDDQNSGTQTDYLEQKSTTNELAVSTPYEVSFRCFSSELASVLARFASSPYGFIVKAINVEPAPAVAPAEQPLQPVFSQQILQPAADTAAEEQQNAERNRQRMMSRYGIGPGGRGRYSGGPAREEQPAPVQPQIMPGVTLPVRGGLSTVLDEKQLKVTMALTLVKLLPPK